MDIPATRRAQRRRRKARERGTQTLWATLAIGIIGALTLSSTSMAMASEAPSNDDASVVSEVTSTPEGGSSATTEDDNDVDATDAPSGDAVEEDATPEAETVTELVVVNDTQTARTESKPKESDQPKKVFVCKYVGTPGVNERLQTGNNPISVSVNSLKGFPGTFPWAFADAQGRSVAITYDTGQPEPSVADCPQPEKPFDWNWQYAAPTCDGLTVAYPNNIPAGSNHKDVNIRVKNLTTGETKTFNFHDSNFDTNGQTVTYKVTDHPDWPGWTYYEVQWTQVHGTNYHWEGSVICGTSPPPPCVQKVTWSYTFDGVGSGTITASAKDAKQGAKLCDALAVRATTYEYDRPASGNPSWPQTLVGYNDLLVDSIGTFSYGAPALDVCRQHDIYAEFVSKGGFDKLAVPAKLNGPNNPYEPQFLHQALSGKGPNPTYSSTSSSGCNTPPSTPEPKVEYTTWVDSEWVCGDSEVTQTRTKTTTPYKVIVQDGKYVTVVDTANIKVVTETQARALTEEEIESCKPEIPEPKVTYTEWVDGEWVCGDTEVTQSRTKITTPYKVVLVKGSTWEVIEDTENVTTTVETRTRALTEDEIESCKVPPTTPPSPTPTPTPSATPTPTATPTATITKLPNTGSDSAGLVWLGAGALGALILGVGLMVLRRRHTEQ